MNYTALTNTAVPDVKTDFTTLSRRMPITSTAQAAGREVHDIGGVFDDGIDANARWVWLSIYTRYEHVKTTPPVVQP